MKKQNPKTKDEARQYAMDYQRYAGIFDMSYGQVAIWQAIFRELAERFNLVDEFKENGII